MTASDGDAGLATARLWGLAGLLGLLSVGAWVQFALLLDGPESLNWELGLYLAVGSMGSVFSACCSVVAAIKAAEVKRIAATGSAESTHR
jgi:hypothetical protein